MKKTSRKLTRREREAFALVGSLGGRATARKLGKGHMRSIAKAGAKKRWAGKEKK